MTRSRAALQEPFTGADVYSPLRFGEMAGGRPNIHFHWKEVGGKRRLIGNPNKATRRIHELLRQYLWSSMREMRDESTLCRLPSSTAFVKGSNPLKNACAHSSGKFFYITDVRDAYKSVDLERLALLIVYIVKHEEYESDFSISMLGQSCFHQDVLREDLLFAQAHEFLVLYCSGLLGQGLAVGGPLSPFLFNLYCEVFMDSQLRELCGKARIVYTRYADDCVFSRSIPVFGDLRRQIRAVIKGAGFEVNHRKSRFLVREKGTVFVTKVGLREEGVSSQARLVYPKRKRRRLHGIIGSFLEMKMDWPEKVSGFVSDFLYYYKNVAGPTATDRKTFALCKKFEAEWAKYKRR